MKKSNLNINPGYLIVLVLLILAAAYFLTQDASHNSPAVYKVTKIKDGDTIIVEPPSGKNFTCRLYGIDAPETAKKEKEGQPFADEAAEELQGLVLDENVTVTMTGEKSYNREICMLSRNGTDINMEMIKRGYAWAYRQYLAAPYASEYIVAESEARQKKLGLWHQSHPEPPWEFRRKE